MPCCIRACRISWHIFNRQILISRAAGTSTPLCTWGHLLSSLQSLWTRAALSHMCLAHPADETAGPIIKCASSLPLRKMELVSHAWRPVHICSGMLVHPPVALPDAPEGWKCDVCTTCCRMPRLTPRLPAQLLRSPAAARSVSAGGRPAAAQRPSSAPISGRMVSILEPQGSHIT